ncbi:MAG: bifunctional alpha,alpha-trehalose-phosphate synthase (UDP-forming)/trehalose-phosphatase [Gemmatimonadetes bacterium]|nr:bifunctional alpha,alpha-trehalose-phosphate synthase (UDP-forming)/trehalose-phosphatase [Gemmatimonadota bacterium]
MKRIILVSNRLPVTVEHGADGFTVTRSVGGLATALRGAHAWADAVWIGWPGACGPLDEHRRARLDLELARLGTVPVHLSAEEVAGFYDGFANGLLWPLFHYITGVLPLRLEGWREYQEVNARFADAVARNYRPDDLVWVHDYQLMLVPGMLRRRLPEARIGFFLHIPFPSVELFATLPHREKLLEGLLGSDLVGFHTDAYRRHFADSVHRILGARTDPYRIRHAGRDVRLGTFPIGVDPAVFAEGGQRQDVAREVAALRGDGSCKLLVGIDRLDYTKGISRRLLAFDALLANRPEWRGRVRLVQIAVPSRTGVRAYTRLRNEVDALVGRINGTYGTAHWTPVHYINRAVPQTQLFAFYRAADAMLVTPLRDGMNLVAKEFVATRTDEDGVLVLSEFAGAAAELTEAVLVNPYDVERTAEAYHRALTMPAPERQARMRALRRHVLENDVYSWADSFLRALAIDRSTSVKPTFAPWPPRRTPAGGVATRSRS